MPATLQLLAFEREVEVSLCVTTVRIAVGHPAAAIPDQHRAAAILAFRNRAFERVVLDRMVFDMHGEPFFAGHEAGPARHRPAFHHAVELEPQIVMQAGGRMLLNDERIAAALDLATARLGGNTELTFLAIFLKS